MLRRLRSVGEFNAQMREDLLWLFHTPDSLTGKERTTDYWLQFPNYCTEWIRMVHRKRTNTQDIGDMLTAERYTYVVASQFLN